MKNSNIGAYPNNPHYYRGCRSYTPLWQPVNCCCPGVNDAMPNVINNINTCLDKGNCNRKASRDICPPVELIRNGGFETVGIQTAFADWSDNVQGLDIRIGAAGDIAYEGRLSAHFDIEEVPSNTSDTATLSQTVSVKPGCYLTLSFAERLAEKPLELEFYFNARVYYISESNEVDLIKIEKIEHRLNVVESSAFSYHEKTSEIPVPENVSFVIVKFTVSINTISSSNEVTNFYLDEVSLKTV